MRKSNSKLWRENTNLDGELLEVGDARVHLLHEHLELGDRLRVREILRLWRPGAAEEHVQEGPDPDLPLDLLVALEGVLSEVGGNISISANQIQNCGGKI